MKRSHPQLIGDIIEQALKESESGNTFNEYKLCAAWPDVVGPGINRYTTRRFIDNGVLHVYISSASLKNELQFMRFRLVEDLNHAVGAQVINSVVFH